MDLLKKIHSKSAKIGIIGLGYVGLPLALEFAKKEFVVLAFDIDNIKIEKLRKGESYIKHIESEKIKSVLDTQKFIAESDFTRLAETDVIIICVPTPLNVHREPDLTFVINTSKTIQKYIRKGHLIVLESTTYPGTTEEILLPLFERPRPNVKYKVGKDFFLAFSPEREDPNNLEYTTSTIPKVVGGITKKCTEITCALYDKITIETVPVSSAKTAEATKLLENIYRSVNIALVNELKMIFDKMNIDIWEVIEAAKTKPFGFQAFYPGPGLGGHCIPIDPFYLSWKAKEYDFTTKFIELAGEINTLQPYYVVERLTELLNKRNKPIKESKILIVGVAYKKNVDDLRESPALKLIDILQKKDATVKYFDPFIPKLPKTRKYEFVMKSIALTKENLKQFDAVLIVTDHDMIDYNLIAKNSKLIIDTRNIMGRLGIFYNNIFKS
ncbi:nucleotide sugar dehydrogenase [Melioribacteraceae bacterium 4301-Me]|uniref:nucleotide sugar dehydrogenase n=1 Tax=Pyranulibacter aquaticus TaxID=3163344 RepID=UPI00359544B0